MFNFNGRLRKVLDNLQYKKRSELSSFFETEINGIKITKFVSYYDDYTFYIDYNGTKKEIGYLFGHGQATFTSGLDKKTRKLLNKCFQEIIAGEETIIELRNLTDKQKQKIEDKKLNSFIQSWYY